MKPFTELRDEQLQTDVETQTLLGKASPGW